VTFSGYIMYKSDFVLAVLDSESSNVKHMCEK